ncbi:MAG: EAL domain-containing protein [Gallionella sp.]|nr:EAL domain-containing protein [Gallionella sp.]
MKSKLILPVLYEMSLAIGGETSLQPLLTRTLQRLLYFTSFPAGFICLDLPENPATDTLHSRISAAVGDFELFELIGQSLELPSELLCGMGAREIECPQLLSGLPTSTHYNAYLRLPIDEHGVIILLAPRLPESELPLTQMFMPIMSNLAKSIKLCRQHDAHNAAVAAQQELMQQSLQRSEFSLRTLLELSPIGIGFSSDGIAVDVNPAFLALFGYDDVKEIRDKPLYQLIAPQCRAEIKDRAMRRAQGLPVEELYETTGLRKDGTEFPVLVAAKRVVLPEGPMTFSFFIDITERKNNEQQLSATNELLHSVLETAPVRIFWKDAQLHYLGCNSLFAHDAGLQQPAELIGKDDYQMGWHEQADIYRADDRHVMDSELPKVNFEEPQTTPDGKTIWLRTSKLPLRNPAGKVIGILGLYDDITAHKEAEAQIRHLAFYDPLTGLPNRRLFADRLQLACATSQRTQNWCALLLFDLDHFKVINDTRGHSIGDKVLVEVAKRVQACVREGDTVARFGGDEFVVILDNLSSAANSASIQAENVADKIRSQISSPYLFDDTEYHITPSIGITLFLGHNVGEEFLMARADNAMYQAKTAGRNCLRFYDPVMQQALEARTELESALRNALPREELELFYQPQVDHTGKLLGAEALLRWRQADGELVSPARFIPVAEETSLILPIGDWVRKQACTQLARWAATKRFANATLSVNVSAREFRHPDFVGSIRTVLAETNINPEQLKLELTESLLIENVESSIRKITELKSLGIRFSIDDFGTGYSSLSYLKSLPLDQIKIDQSFVRDIASDPNDAAIVKTVVAMAKSLDLDIIAEGVENEAQRAFLQGCGCNSFQGYLFGRPVPASEFEQTWLRN